MSARRNDLNREGTATAPALRADRPVAIHFIQGVARTLKGSDRVRSLRFPRDGIAMTSRSGVSVSAPMHWRFVRDGRFSRRGVSRELRGAELVERPAARVRYSGADSSIRRLSSLR